MYKAYKFRIYPSYEQRILLNKSFGCARLVYNYYLELSLKNGYKNSNIYIKDYIYKLKYEYPFLTEVDSIIIRQSIFNLDKAYQNYFNIGFGNPRYKSKFSKNSYTISAVYRTYKDKKYCNIELNLDKRELKLPKLKWVTIMGYRNLKFIDRRIINATISKEANGKYYVSILYEVPELLKKYVTPRNIIGIDLGVKKLITLSDTTVYENNKYIEKYEKRIKRLQRSLSRKKKQIKNMLEKKVLSKSIQDASFYEIIRQLKYKAKFKGKQFYQVDIFYPSSQTCSICNCVSKKYKNLNKRVYYCSNCHNELDRDLNVSINIMFEGLKLYMNNNFSTL